jgi:poly(3-hydroxybutyrate) depolymerase
MSVTRDWSRLYVLGLAAIASTCLMGCPAVSNLPSPGRVVTDKDPERGQTYHLYVPTRYRPDSKWPLVVTCHGTPPFDNAVWQLNEWKGLAEEKGFLVVAPELTGTSAVSLSSSEQVRRQLDDEAQILSIVRTIRASHNIDDTRIFLTGWSAGGYAVLFTGLRHPDLFRAIAIRQGNFNKAYVESCVPFLDRYQPVMVVYGNIDPLKDDAQACVEWLRSNDLDPTALERPGAHRRDPSPVYAFFADVVRHRPWIRVRIEDDAADAMNIRFSLKTSFEPVQWLWDFGDKQRSTMEKPGHRYERPGAYTVRVAAYPQGAKAPYVRQVQVQVPRVRLGTAAPATSAAR